MTPPGGRRLRLRLLGVRPGPRNTAGVIPLVGRPWVSAMVIGGFALLASAK